MTDDAETARLRVMVANMADRIALQSDALGRAACRPPEERELLDALHRTRCALERLEAGLHGYTPRALFALIGWLCGDLTDAEARAAAGTDDLESLVASASTHGRSTA